MKRIEEYSCVIVIQEISTLDYIQLVYESLWCSSVMNRRIFFTIRWMSSYFMALVAGSWRTRFQLSHSN